MKPNLFHTQFFRLFFLILLAGISIQTYAAKDSQAAPKKRTITGTVISEGDNMPIIGANVWLKNSSTGAITDLDGKYSITIDNSVVGGVLVFSYIGMSTQEVAIGNQNVINVTLKFDTVIRKKPVSSVLFPLLIWQVLKFQVLLFRVYWRDN